jgi:hypothetical protein
MPKGESIIDIIMECSIYLHNYNQSAERKRDFMKKGKSGVKSNPVASSGINSGQTESNADFIDLTQGSPSSVQQTVISNDLDEILEGLMDQLDSWRLHSQKLDKLWYRLQHLK